MATILIVDDEKNIRTHLATYVRGLGHQVECASDGAGALAAIERDRFEIVLSDVRMAGIDGLALLKEIRQRAPDSVVALMTAYATVPQAVEAMRAGAYDYLVKPFALDEVGLLLDRILELQTLRRENAIFRRTVERRALLQSANPIMQEALATVRRVGESDATVLLTGESGTGKNVLAAAIHECSRRSTGPFITIGCTTLSEHLLESELFGHVRGAFTGAWKDTPGRIQAAQGGTVFLDEVGELSAPLQAKLLRFLEERRFEAVGGRETIVADVRIIAATNRDLEDDMRTGRFRQDLFFRLNVIGIRIPALRERAEDVPALIDHLLTGLRLRHRRTSIEITDDARRALATYDWPGNIRELLNVLERAVVLARTNVIGMSDLPDRLVAPRPISSPAPGFQRSLEDLERGYIQEVLADSATLEEAAARLGINTTTLWRKRKRYGID